MREPLPPAEVRMHLPPDGGPDFNRLIHATSPYLLQHARNPVDWFPWGPEALEKAKREDKPIFLSVGYSACHWCHVMEHESFEDAAVAQLLNELCVPVKVDREERPDLDDLYMVATQIMTGRGGWPNSVWLMPDGRPWYAGTYFPREDRGGQPGFKTLLVRLDEIWKSRRPEIEQQAAALTAAIQQNAAAAVSNAAPATRADLQATLDQALRALEEEYDPRHGGFGGAPKFPPHSTLRLLLAAHARDPQPARLAMIQGTLDAMQAGGIHDHIGGGFHRYATDARWFLPHFEKMLYDNAQLARLYAEAYRITSNAAYAATARDTFDWVLRDMADPAGGFHSALDADSEGEEGRFYVWTRAQVEAVLGPAEAESFARAYGFTAGGNYHEEATGHATGANIPFLAPGAPRPAQPDALRKLREARARRVWPARDDKVLTAWNGLMIGALAIGSRDLKEPRYLEAATRAAEFLLTRMRHEGRLLRSWRDGQARIPAYLDDHAALVDALLDLHEVTREPRWRDEAVAVARAMVHLFRDERDGTFYFTAADHEQLLTRSKDAFDQAAPSGNGLTARALIRLGRALGARNWIEQGADIVRALTPAMQRSATGAGTLLEACSMYLSVPESLAMKRERGLTLLAERLEAAAPDGPPRIRLRVWLDDGWHIHPHEGVPEGRMATTITCDPAAAVAYPPAVALPDGQSGYAGETLFDLTPEPGTAPGRAIRITLQAQPCDATRCLAPAAWTVQAAIAP